MDIRQAESIDFDAVKNITHTTIREVYPRYYPKGAVAFFLAHHNDAAIMEDIAGGMVFLLENDREAAGTVTLKDGEIGRLFVLPACQGKGFGGALLDFAEQFLSRGCACIRLHSSLPAKSIYLKRGYAHVSSHAVAAGNGDYLCYDVMQKSVFPPTSGINYNGRSFVPKMNSDNGEADGQTVFHYRQEAKTVWAEYAGGEIVRGHLIGTVSDDGALDFHYQHINADGHIRIGKCRSIPHWTENGKLELHENWQWLNGDFSKGRSVVVEQ